MADTGDGQSLLAGSGGEQSAGTAEEDPLQLSFLQLIQKVTA